MTKPLVIIIEGPHGAGKTHCIDSIDISEFGKKTAKINEGFLELLPKDIEKLFKRNTYIGHKWALNMLERIYKAIDDNYEIIITDCSIYRNVVYRRNPNTQFHILDELHEELKTHATVKMVCIECTEEDMYRNIKRRYEQLEHENNIKEYNLRKNLKEECRTHIKKVHSSYEYMKNVINIFDHIVTHNNIIDEVSKIIAKHFNIEHFPKTCEIN